VRSDKHLWDAGRSGESSVHVHVHVVVLFMCMCIL